MYARRRDDTDGLIQPDRLEARPHYGSLVIDDATGVVLTTPTSAADIKGSPMAAGESNGCTLSATDGSITIVRPGKYRIEFAAGEIVGVNSQAVIVEVYKGAAVLAKAVLAKITQPATALPIVSLAAGGIVDLERGDVITFRATASTGNFTCKRGRFSVTQLDDDSART